MSKLPDKLQEVIANINKAYGQGSVMELGSKAVVEIEVIPSGSLGLDRALGIGGYPRGRVVEIYGPESAGKTTLALHAIAEAQKLGGRAAFVDAEYAFDRKYAQAIGIDVDHLIVSQPSSGEEALEVVERLIRSGEIAIVVIDSVAALTPQAEIDGEMGDSKMGLHARLMSQAMRKLTAIVGQTNTCCVFINQMRDKIGVVYGSPETTTGGNALKFYASVRIDVRRREQIKEEEEAMGNKTVAKVVKNKVAPPFRKAEFDIIYGHGISRHGEVFDLAVGMGVIKKSGSWFSFSDSQLGQGRKNVIEAIINNPGLYEELEKLLK